MRSTKIEKCHRKINDAFAGALDAAFFAKFQRECETRYSIFSMTMVSAPKDGGSFTPEQFSWIEAFSDGYGKAMNMVHED